MIDAPQKITLEHFQERFARALVGEAAPEIAALAAQPGFAVYRNTVMKGCVDALQANYPAVYRLVGEEWFRAAAAIYARAHLPQTPMLLEYGAGFADFLRGFPPAAGLPYLPGVARLDRFWTEAHIAPEAEPLDPARVAGLDGETLAHTRLAPHPSARWGYFADAPVATIWRRNRDEGAFDGDIAWRAEGILLVRPYAAVGTHDLDAAGCAFLDACARGATLAEAASKSLETDAQCELSELLARLIAAGAFGRLDVKEPEEEDT